MEYIHSVLFFHSKYNDESYPSENPYIKSNVYEYKVE